MILADRETIHKAVDALSPQHLAKVGQFIAYLQQENAPGSPWAKALYDLFAPVREAATDMTEDEINQLIDEELDMVRR